MATERMGGAGKAGGEKERLPTQRWCRVSRLPSSAVVIAAAILSGLVCKDGTFGVRGKWLRGSTEGSFWERELG